MIGLASQKRYISLYVCATDAEGYISRALPRPAAEGRHRQELRSLQAPPDVDESVLRELVHEAAERFAADPAATFAQ